MTIVDDWGPPPSSEDDSRPRRKPRRVPPHNQEAEAALLGAMLISPDAVANAIEIVDAEHFYGLRNRQVFEAMWELYRRSEPVDYQTVSEELRRRELIDDIGGAQALAELADAVPASVNAAYYGRIVREAWLLRRLVSIGGEIAEMGFEVNDDVASVIDRAEQKLYDLSQNRSQAEFSSMSDLMREAYAAIEDRYNNKEPVIGLSTGFPRIDAATTGLKPGNLVVIAARPGMGKSALALNIAAHAAIREHKGVGVFSLEMSSEEVAERLLCAEARVDADNVKKGMIRDSEWPKITNAAGSLEGAPMLIDESPYVTIMEMRARCRRMASRHPLGLVVVDYIQLMDSARDARSQENRATVVAEISRGLKVLARELGVPVLACAQLNRMPEARADKRPMLGDLRESGSIEQDADIVMFIYRDSYYNADSKDVGLAEIHIAKNRNGRTDRVTLSFLDHCTRFESVAVGAP